jgi:hypothetical protein
MESIGPASLETGRGFDPGGAPVSGEGVIICLWEECEGVDSSGDCRSSGWCCFVTVTAEVTTAFTAATAVAATESNWSTPFIGLNLESFWAELGINSEISGVELIFFTVTTLSLFLDSFSFKCGIVRVGWFGKRKQTTWERKDNIVDITISTKENDADLLPTLFSVRLVERMLPKP